MSTTPDELAAREPVVRSTLLGCLLHLERTTAAALSCIAPNAWSWGNLSADNFLMIFTGLTTWSLTHFESV
jgi:hypothetical protein